MSQVRELKYRPRECDTMPIAFEVAIQTAGARSGIRLIRVLKGKYNVSVSVNRDMSGLLLTPAAEARKLPPEELKELNYFKTYILKYAAWCKKNGVPFPGDRL